MEITNEKEGDVLVLTVKGDLNSHTSPQFEQVLLPAIDSGQSLVLIDAAGMNYISSAGLRVILKARQKLAPKKGKMAICSLPPMVQDVFEMAGFSGVLPLAKTRADALRALHA
ncbi:MAG TPA: STAS domain-containing protein [Verrucomicrobiae bacterium]|nr:STAS domain-containing protein [Verrucomicrobiae bacterium]